jgi:PHD/YefM family antitoxin component YafN of YafNO toxin-antitoxin module
MGQRRSAFKEDEDTAEEQRHLEAAARLLESTKQV